MEGQVFSTGNFCLTVPTTQHDGWLLAERAIWETLAEVICLLLPCPGNYTTLPLTSKSHTIQSSVSVRMGHPSTWIEEGRIIGGHHGGWLPNYSKFAGLLSSTKKPRGFPSDAGVKNLPTMQETRVWSLGQEDPMEKEMATHSSILAWEIPRTEEPGGLQSIGSQRVRQDLVAKQQQQTTTKLLSI